MAGTASAMGPDVVADVATEPEVIPGPALVDPEALLRAAVAAMPSC